MSNELELQSNADVISQSIAEMHVLLSVLEEQIKLGLFSTPSKAEPTDAATSEETPSAAENCSSPTHEL